MEESTENKQDVQDAPEHDMAKDVAEGKTFTQADVDAAIEAAKSEWKTSLKEQLASAKSEGEKLAKMTAAERREEEMRIEREKLDNEKAEFERKTMVSEVKGQLADKGLPSVFADMIAADTLDTDGKPLSLAEQDMVAIKATMRLGYLVVKDNAFAAWKNGVPALGALTVTSTAGEIGKSVISVSPKPIGGHKLVYKTAASTAPTVTYDADLSSWTELSDGAEITATSGHKITVAEVTADGKARKSGNADVVSGS